MAIDRINVFSALANRNWQPDAMKGGNTVKIGTLTTDINVVDYTVNSDLANAQLLTDETQDLVLDQQKAFHFYLDDVNAFQSTPDIMTEAMRKSAVKISETMDSYMANIFKAGITGARLITKADDFADVADGYMPEIRQLRRKMKDANIGKDMPLFLVVPPFFMEKLDEYLTTVGANGSLFVAAAMDDSFRNGYSGMLNGFRLIESTALADGASGTKRLIAGTMEAVTYASQIEKIEAYRPDKRFGDAMKGLYVYGAKVVDSNQLFGIDIKKP